MGNRIAVRRVAKSDDPKPNGINSSSTGVGNKTSKTDETTKWTNFTYDIHETELEKFKSSEFGTGFKSQRFKSEHDIKWRLQIYPNGIDKENNGYCNAFLCLSSKPQEYGAVIIYCRLSCDQTCASGQYMSRYNKTEGHGWTKGSQSFSEMSALEPISFSCKFRVLRIYDKSENILYEYLLDTSSLWKQESFQWNIDETLFQQMKTASLGKHFCPMQVLSDSGMYSIGIWPNGLYGWGPDGEDKVFIELNLCAIPRGIHTMKLCWTINVPEVQKSISWTWWFNEDICSWQRVLCDVQDLSLLEKITIAVTVDILECYSDAQETVVPNVQFKALTNVQNENDADELESSDLSDEEILKEYNIRKGKALVAIVCVKEYESKAMEDLDGAQIDRQNLKELFEAHFEYETRILDKDKVTLQDFDKFIFGIRNELYANADEYDAFILSFTGHGYRDSICLSDSKNFGRIDLYKWFNGRNCMPFKDKPKLFLLQACKGLQDAPNLKEQGLVAAPGIGVSDEDLPVAPDDNIVIFESNSDGYVSWMNGDGGFMVQSFVKVMKRNKNRMRLDDMSKMMENEMKKLNKQMATVETLVCKQYGVKDIIYFCKSDE